MYFFIEATNLPAGIVICNACCFFRDRDVPNTMVDAFQASSPTSLITLQDSIITALKGMENLRVRESK